MAWNGQPPRDGNDGQPFGGEPRALKMRYAGETMQQQYIERVVDLTELEANQFYRLTIEEARETVLYGMAEAAGRIAGSFALVAREGKTVKLARSLDRPLRYFLAKRQAGPVLIFASRIDAFYNLPKSEGLAGQFHPSYTRMVPAHHVVTLELIGCPDPDPVYTRFFTPPLGGGTSD